MPESFLRKLLLTSVIFCVISGQAFPQTFNASLAAAKNHLTNAQSYLNKSAYPRSTKTDGTISRVSSSDWTSGFFPGSLWLMYEHTKDPAWRVRAEQWTAGLENQKNTTSTHDVGFILYSSFGAGYRLTQNEAYKAILLQGAKSLSTRFNSITGSIKSWNNKPPYTFPVIIDNMMNLEILFWATKVSGDSSYYKIAVRHALTTMANHFRPDNSSFHVVDYNPTTGSIISKSTHQGLSNSSDWARGQAWGLYGFTMCYRETGDVRFLTMANKIADFYIAHPAMPKDFVPYWDFDATDFRDASAASVSASALLELSQYIPASRMVYYNFGLSILNALSSSAYLAAASTNNNFLLKHGVGNKPKNSEVDKPLVYADYYFIQAMLRHTKPAPVLSATPGQKLVNLKWNVATGATKYRVKRSVVKGGPYTTIDSNITATTYINTGLPGGQTYYYVVTSANTFGEGIASAEVTATPVDSSSGLVTNVSANTGRSYALGTLFIGAKLYTDRIYMATSVPLFLVNAILIKTPNSDKANTGKEVLSFTLNQNATVYIAYDPRAKVLPAWLNGWQKVTDQKIGINDANIAYLNLYSRSYPAGKISLDGNLASPASGAQNNYFVVVLSNQMQKQQSLSAINADITGIKFGDDNVFVNLQDERATSGLKIYPNPNFSGKFLIEAVDFLEDEMVTISIQDIQGNIIQSEKIKADSKGSFKKYMLWPVAKRKGLYIIKAASASETLRQKLVIN